MSDVRGLRSGPQEGGSFHFSPTLGHPAYDRPAKRAPIGTFSEVILWRNLANRAIKPGIAEKFDHNSSFFAINLGDLVFTITRFPEVYIGEVS